jgi:mitogen-activated protein kinase kinase kinase 1
MELAELSLKQLLRDGSKLTEQQDSPTCVERRAIFYARQILSGIKYFHDQGLPHRDIKCDNILIDATGTAKLACSTLIEAATGRCRKGGCKAVIGTAYWMAPELFRNEAYGTKADIWSFGCAMVEVLNGGGAPWPVVFDNPVSAYNYIVLSPTLEPNIPVHVSELCRSFINRCLDRDAGRRADVDALLVHPWIVQP